MFDRSALAVLSMVFGPVVFALSVGVPSAGWADDDPALPDFATCMDLTVARFERELGRVVSLPQQDRDFDIGDVRGVDFCVTGRTTPSHASTTCGRIRTPCGNV
jgi:hypothetical protein